MMKIKFNKFERIAGIFVLGAITLFIFAMFSVAIKQGWFDSKIPYLTTFDNADGVHPGSMVQMAGLRAGSVDSVDLTSDNKILIHFHVLSKFQDKVKTDSVAQLVRPFIIGERVLEISVGSENEELLLSHKQMLSSETTDIMTIMSGKNLNQYLKSFSTVVDNLKVLVEAFSSKDRTQAFIQAFDRIDPLLKNLNTMSIEMVKLSRQVTKDEKLPVLLGELTYTTQQINAMIPMVNKTAPQLAQDMTALVSNLNVLTEQFKVFLPALAEVAPELPHASRRAIEALDQAVILMKAMQKSMFISSSAEEVKEEEKKQEAQRQKEKALLKNNNANPPSEDNSSRLPANIGE